MSKIVCIGEALYDIIFKDGKPVEGKAGGSVLNAAVSLGKLKCNVYFVGEVGMDCLGNQIIEFLSKNNVKVDHLERAEKNTPLAIAILNEHNNAKYTFYKSVSQEVRCDEVNFNSEDFFLFGSSYALDDNSSVKILLQKAMSKNAVIVYDPNFRKTFAGNEKLQMKVRENISCAAIVRASDEDMNSIFEARNHGEAYQLVRNQGCEVLVYTCGSKGIWLCTPHIIKFYETPIIKALSTIGAGDTFNAGIIYYLYKNKIAVENLSKMTNDFWDRLIGVCIDFATDVCLSFDNYVSSDISKEFTI